MSKSNKILTTLLLGAAGGAAAAIFLASKTGKTVKNKVKDFVNDYKENPEAKHSEWADKAAAFKNQATEKYSDVKHKFETGEISADSLVNSVKEKANAFKERVTQDYAFAAEEDSEVTDFADEDEPVSEEMLTIDHQPEDITIDIADVADSFDSEVTLQSSDKMRVVLPAADGTASDENTSPLYTLK